jgi:formamidopyrimidine-DNA glycosylase
MPELPDLQVFSMNLKKHILNKPIVSAAVHNSRKMNVLSDVFANGLINSHIVDIERVGKELYFHLSNGNVFSVHLMLNGQFKLSDAEKVGSIQHKIISIVFQDNSALSVSDYQSLCKVTFNPKKSSVPDALSEKFDYAYFAGVAGRNSRMNVKAFLIDQKILKGIGNAYADEILWKADISPESVVGRIPEEALSGLFAAIGDVLRDAIDNILKIAPDIISGEERGFLKVHNPRKKATEEGDPILVKEIATKRTYYTKKQRLFI